MQPGYPTYNTAKLYVNFSVTYAASYKVRFWLYLNNTLITQTDGATYTLAAGGSKDNLTKTFSNLQPDSSYRVDAELYNAGNGAALGITDSISFDTPAKPAPVRPDDWVWESTVRAGATVATTKGSDGVYRAKYLTASEWNGFVERVLDFLEYKGLSVTGSYGYVSVGEEMDAAQVSAVRQMISLMSPPLSLPTDVSSGSAITAATINGLKDSLNSIQ